MNQFQVTDSDLESVVELDFDIAIFASGYENRCTEIAKKVDISKIRNIVLLEFENTKRSEEQRQHTTILEEELGVSACNINSIEEDKKIFTLLDESLGSSMRGVNVLIDYSSMTRSWYCAILNFFRIQNKVVEANLYFCYSEGRYPNGYQDKSVAGVESLSGCEGTNLGLSKSVALVGLGFDPHAPYYAVDNLEPDECFAYIAAPGNDNQYYDLALNRNRSLVEDFLQGEDKVLRLPLRSVRTAYIALIEMATPYLARYSTVIVPFGPKPHVLASILVAMKFPQIACLYVKTKVERKNMVEASGKYSVSKVSFECVV